MVSFLACRASGLLTPVESPPKQPDFNVFAYTLDVVIPVLNLHQREAWNAHGAAQWLVLLFVAVGWLLTTAVVLGLSGILKRD